MSLFKKTVVFMLSLMFIHQLTFAQKDIKSAVPGTSAKSLSSNVQIFFYVGVFEKSVAHMIWENFDEPNIREVILESSFDGNYFTTCSRAEISSLPDIHLINYPKELEYNNTILKSSEHGNIRFIYNDKNINFDFGVQPKWYRLKMLTFSGFTYISQTICTKNTGEIIKESVSGITHNDNYSSALKETSGYSWLPGNKAGCSPVGTPPSGYTVTNIHQYAYGDNCCYNKLTLYEGPIVPSVNQCGNYGTWCCDDVPEAASCPSGYAEDPCCVHPCGQYNQCSCQPWQCCQGQHAQAWVVTEVGQAGTPSIPAPTASPAGVCGSGTSTLSASSAGYQVYWYTGSCGGTFVASGSPISVTVSTTTTFYVRAWSASCGVSDCGTVTVQVYPLPGAVTVNGGGTQCGGSRTLTASGGTGGTIYWQGTTSSGTSTASPSTSQSVSASGTYYFRTYSANGCWGPEGSASVTINPIPADPLPVANPATICSGGTTSLSATVANSKIYWYTGSCGGALIGSGSPITVTIGATTTFYARAYNVTTGCWSAGCGSVTVSMGTVSTPAPVASPPGICGSGSSTLTATVPGATLYWYSGSCGGTSLGTGNSITVSPTATTTYYVRALSGSCAPSACGTVTVTIGTPVNQTITGTTPICVGGTSTFTSTTSGGTWTSSAPGAATVNPSTGVITGVSAGTSVITYSVTTGGCVNTATKSVTISAAVPQVLTGTTLLCAGSTSTWTSTTSGGSWTSGSVDIATVNSSTGLVTAVGPGSTVITYSVTTGGGCINTATMSVTVNHPAVVNISGGTSPICSNSNPGTLSATAISGNGTYTYQWYTTASIINGATNSTFNPGNITDTTGYYCEVTSGICGAVNSNTITINVFPQLTADPIPDTSICTKTSPGTFTANVHGGTGPYSYLWYWDGTSTGVTSSTYNPGIIQTNANFHCVITNTCGTLTTPVIHVTIISPVGNPSPITVGGGTEPVCQLTNGTTTTQYTTNAPNATGYNWSISNPAAGSIDANGLMTWANGFYGTVNIEVTANGCDGPSIMVTRTVTVNLCGTGHNISGKTRYCGKANNGNPIPNPPTYNSVIYDINKVIVILKNYPSGNEVARDTSDALGAFLFSNVADGTYMLSYDKYTADTMQWGDNINAIDVALVKYFVGSDTLVDPSRCFSAKYKRAANVDNNTLINSIDVARLKAKVGNPSSVSKNFPGGNWPAFDTIVTVAGADLNVILKTICYGDYNASSSKYKDSVTTWSMAKSISTNIIGLSDEFITTSDPYYFEIPLKINSKMNDFSALGLELNYPANNYDLERAIMIKSLKNTGPVKINPTLEEIISEDNDLLVTNENGIIRVVFATTNHCDVAANDELIRLGFRSHKKLTPGEVLFDLNGTGVIGNQYGEENPETYLMMPKILVQGDNADNGFEFAAYPNPFNNSATITYNLPEPGTVKLLVYNAIGELAIELVNEVQEVGRHSVTFSAEDLPSGMYTFKLDYAGQNSAKSLVLKLIH